LIKSSSPIFTIIWNYKEARFKMGSRIMIMVVNNIESLKTSGNPDVADNLDNLINMEGLFSAN